MYGVLFCIADCTAVLHDQHSLWVSIKQCNFNLFWDRNFFRVKRFNTAYLLEHRFHYVSFKFDSWHMQTSHCSIAALCIFSSLKYNPTVTQCKVLFINLSLANYDKSISVGWSVVYWLSDCLPKNQTMALVRLRDLTKLQSSNNWFFLLGLISFNYKYWNSLHIRVMCYKNEKIFQCWWMTGKHFQLKPAFHVRVFYWSGVPNYGC